MLAVTTRNKLKSARFLLPMLLARRRVRGQLQRTRGLVRWADAIASPTEFYTLTVWANKQVMFNFMSSDAHRDMLWRFARWSDEFWSMRWLPSEHELGAWSDMHLARRGGLKGNPQSPVPHIAIPPRPGAGPIDPSTCPASAVMAQVDARTLPALRACLRARTGAAPVRVALGSFGWNQYVLISVWKDCERLWSALGELNPSWAMQWLPGDYEIGHWNGLRLRQLGRRQPASLAEVV